MIWLDIIGGLALLAVGGEFLVRGAVAAAFRLGVSPLLIGLTIVGFGTSMPEMVTSVQAALLNAPGISLGNVVGSNTVNILFILGFAALLAPIKIARAAFIRDAAVMLAATGALCFVALSGTLTHEIGALFLGALALYLLVAFFTERRKAEEPAAEKPNLALRGAVGLLALGIAGTLLGAHFLVDGAIMLAKRAGLSESFIGLTIVAAGTSLPELAASTVAALRRQSGIALGNILGSNIFNIFGILGVTGLVRELDVPPDIAGFDIWVMLIAALTLIWFAVSGWRLARWEGLILISGYGAYLWLLISQAGIAL